MDQQLATPEAPSWAKHRQQCLAGARRSWHRSAEPRPELDTRYSWQPDPVPAAARSHLPEARASIWRRCGSRSRGCKPIPRCCRANFRFAPHITLSGISGFGASNRRTGSGKSLEQLNCGCTMPNHPPGGVTGRADVPGCDRIEAMLAEVTELVMPCRCRSWSSSSTRCNDCLHTMSARVRGSRSLDRRAASERRDPRRG